MIKNYLKVALRNSMRQKTFSLINILGFAFGIAVCLLIVLFLIKEYSYDSYHVNASRIYRLIDTANNTSAIDYRVAAAIRDNYPDVKNACVAYVLPMKIGTSFKNDGFNIDGIMSVNNAFFEMFTTHFVYGNSVNSLPNPNSVVLTESSARKIFGSENPIGKEIVLDRQVPLRVTGVIEDFPKNSSIHANIIVNMENRNFKFSFSCGDYKDISSHRYPFNIYLLLGEKSDPVQLVMKINSHPETIQPYVQQAGLLALTDTYLRDNATGSTTKKGNPSLLRLFTGIALVVLLLAVMNYINLSLAQQNKRNKETGIRKTIGADRKSIVSLFVTESVLVTGIAFMLALVIAEITLPFFSGIVDSRLSMRPLMQFPGNIVLFLTVLLIGVLSGIIPAVLFSSFNPVRILSGRLIASGRNNYLRCLLTGFQFTVSIALIFCIMVIQRQIDYAKNENLGFEKEQLVRIKFPFADAATVLVNRLRECASVKNVSVSNGVPGEIHMNMGSGIEDIHKRFSCIAADSNFLNTFNIQLIKGRGLIPGDYGQACMINETAYKFFGWDNLDNKRFNNGREGGFEVIGVVKDFHIASLHQPIEPTCILFTDQFSLSDISFRIEKGTTAQTMTYLQKVWKEVCPDYPLDYHFYDEWFNQMYAKDERFANAISMFGFLAITISCLGVLGLMIFSLERRAKEIAIRKVHGASVNNLMFSLNKDFIKWVVVAFVVACPIGWYAMTQWLQDFAYRTEMSWWIFAISGLMALAIALLTVSWQTWRAVTRNPVEALRYE